jgi:hypothetical protein
VAVAASMLTSAWHMLTKGVPYHELGPMPLTAPACERPAQRHVHRLRELGYGVTLTDNLNETSTLSIPPSPSRSVRNSIGGNLLIAKGCQP